jgi:hypothetical protein
MWRALKAEIPKTLDAEDPSTILEILDICNLEAGISQALLKKQLKEQLKKDYSQPYLSKLMDHLRRERWIQYARPSRDARQRPLKTSKTGLRWIEMVREDFDGILERSLPPTKKRSRKSKNMATESATYPLLDCLKQEGTATSVAHSQAGSVQR